eukprot:TRINITY_DN50052_c0_g1_i1.p2 TRINITY_DN50052_c0_g1~~TRINITY_DN50052_c0_g1_i1.p2  ORF type:complete len:175 (+),score=27.11 TRINITY_DN50052_c0_g1_i1:29-526(+)
MPCVVPPAATSMFAPPVPNASGRDGIRILEETVRLGKHRNSFGGFPRSGAETHPFFRKPPPQSFVQAPDGWTNVYGKRKPDKPWNPEDFKGKATMHRMQGGSFVIFLPKEEKRPPCSQSTGDLQPERLPRWMSRETYPSSDCWERRQQMPAQAHASRLRAPSRAK